MFLCSQPQTQAVREEDAAIARRLNPQPTAPSSALVKLTQTFDKIITTFGMLTAVYMLLQGAPKGLCHPRRPVMVSQSSLKAERLGDA